MDASHTATAKQDPVKREKGGGLYEEEDVTGDGRRAT